jgi:Ca-activated chloride channel family protein
VTTPVNFALEFSAPSRLWFLAVVVALLVAYVAFQLRRRPVYAVRFTNLALLDVVAPKRPTWRRHVTAVAFVIGTGLLVVALAEPTRAVEVPVERATIVLAIDTSLSMEATDIEPSRLAAAKDAATNFVETVPDTVNVGLVQFAGTALVAVAPTTDHGDVLRAIDDLELGEGTAIGEAIFAGLEALSTLPEADDPDEAVPATLVVLSDGETTVGRSNQDAVAAAQEAEIPVSTIAFGTDSGVISIEGEIVPVPPNVDALAEIADETHGVSFAAEDEGDLAAAYDDLGSSIGYETEQREISEWFVGAALVALLAAAVLSLWWFARLP